MDRLRELPTPTATTKGRRLTDERPPAWPPELVSPWLRLHGGARAVQDPSPWALPSTSMWLLPAGGSDQSPSGCQGCSEDGARATARHAPRAPTALQRFTYLACRSLYEASDSL